MENFIISKALVIAALDHFRTQKLGDIESLYLQFKELPMLDPEPPTRPRPLPEQVKPKDEKK